VTEKGELVVLSCRVIDRLTFQLDVADASLLQPVTSLNKSETRCGDWILVAACRCLFCYKPIRLCVCVCVCVSWGLGCESYWYHGLSLCCFVYPSYACAMQVTLTVWFIQRHITLGPRVALDYSYKIVNIFCFFFFCLLRIGLLQLQSKAWGLLICFPPSGSNSKLILIFSLLTSGLDVLSNYVMVNLCWFQGK